MNPDTVAALSRLHGDQRRDALEWNYARFNHSRFRASDPLEFVYGFSSVADRETAAWIAAALAYGRVASIQNALHDLNRRWENQPYAFISQASQAEQSKALRGFVYRWTRAPHVLAHLRGWAFLNSDKPLWQKLAERSPRSPSGETFHRIGYPRSEIGDYRKALIPLLKEMKQAEGDPGHLCPDPAGNSACKRLAMWMRWMVRKDEIDPGIWSEHLRPDKLWVPLDTHMFRIAKQLRLTRRRAPDAEAARRITASFARICPEDPVRYDFAITRLGMGTV